MGLDWDVVGAEGVPLSGLEVRKCGEDSRSGEFQGLTPTEKNIVGWIRSGSLQVLVVFYLFICQFGYQDVTNNSLGFNCLKF